MKKIKDSKNDINIKQNQRYQDILKSFISSRTFFFKPLNEDEVIEEIKKAQNGDKEAEEKVINNNIGLVFNTADKYKNLGLSYEDLISEGFFGLIDAINTFDVNRKIKFSSYAVPCIQNSIRNSLSTNSRLIRIPTNIINLRRKLNKIIDKFNVEHGKNPTIDDLYKSLNKKIEKERIEYILSLPINLELSLDEKVDLNSNLTYVDLLEDVNDISPVESLNKDEEIEILKEAINCLGEREREIILLRYGYYERKFTLDEIGKKYNLTRERVRQIEKKAKFKIKDYFVDKLNGNI